MIDIVSVSVVCDEHSRKFHIPSQNVESTCATVCICPVHDVTKWVLYFEKKKHILFIPQIWGKSATLVYNRQVFLMSIMCRHLVLENTCAFTKQNFWWHVASKNNTTVNYMFWNMIKLWYKRIEHFISLLIWAYECHKADIVVQ